MIAKIAGIVALSMAFVLLLSTAHAFSISAPSDVNISGTDGYFYIDITNDSGEMQDIKVEFFTPAQKEISAPLSVAPNTTSSAKIRLYNDYDADTTIASKLEVYMGKEMESKEINVRFSGNKGAANGGVLGAFFSLGAFSLETANFTLIEWALFWFLVIIAAVLLVAFVARVARRV